MNEQQKHTIMRFALVFCGMLLLFIAVIGKIFSTQYVHDKEVLKRAEKVITSKSTTPANRGNIYDCNGKLLASSIRTYTIFMDTKTQTLRKNNGELFKEHVDELSDSLAACFGDRTAREYKNALMHAYNTGARNFKIYPTAISYEQLQRIKHFPLFNLHPYKGGFKTEERHQRVKPFGSLAARSIGDIYGVEKKGRNGIEKAFDAELHGTDGYKVRTLTDNYYIESDSEEPVNGLDVVTTIDANLQDIVESNLRQTLTRLTADWGCCILMETKTGEIKAISNLGRMEDGSYAEDKNYAVTRVEPGSTFKTYSLMAALDDGKIEIEDSIDVEGGNWQYSDARITDSHRYDGKHYPEPQTIRKSFAVSSNVALSKIITSSYEKKASKFVDKLSRMGICDSTYMEIPGKSQPHIVVPKDGVTLARMAFGYSVELAPVDVLMFYNAIANDGKMIRPFLVKEIQENGRTVREFETSTVKGSICKSSTLDDVRTCLEDVVWDNKAPGTASINPWGNKKAQSDLVHIAGKTGTAQILVDGRYRSDQHRMSFCGYFPMEQPEYTCICVIQRPRNAYDAGYDCGGTVRRIAEKTMAYKGHVSIETMYVNEDSVQLPPIKRGLQTDIRRASRGTKVDVDCNDSEWARVNGDYEAEPLVVQKNLVPNVVGMGAKDAVFAIEQTGMYAKLQGKGKVVKQSVQVGTKVVRGGTIYLELR